MPKTNPWSLARPVYQPVTETFTDPRHPKATFTLTVRPLDACELMLALEQAAEAVEKWITGKPGEAALDYPLGEGKVRLSETLLRAVTLIEAQQRQPDGNPYTPDEFYTSDDLIGLAHLAPDAWSRIGPWARGLTVALDGDDAGNE